MDDSWKIGLGLHAPHGSDRRASQGDNDSTRDHVPVHVCFQGITLIDAVEIATPRSTRALGLQHSGAKGVGRLQEGAQLYTMDHPQVEVTGPIGARRPHPSLEIP